MTAVMSYTTIERIKATLPEVGSMATLTSSQIVVCGADAEALINARLSRRYSIPIAGEVPLLTTIATHLAIYNILTSRITIKAEHPWFARYKMAEALLAKVADGEIPLVTTSGEVVGERSDDAVGMAAWSTTKTYAPTHWEGSWTEHFVDPDKLDSEADKRR